jgi:hypothetical protein
MIKDQDINSTQLDLLNKQFLGVVEDPNDPRKEGRAKIRVSSIYGDIPTDDLPWAYPSQKSTFFGQDGRGGSLSVPKRGSIVTVKFNNGNHYSPEYYALHEIAEDVRTELGKEGEYLGSHVLLFDGDSELKIWFTISKGLTLKLRESSINIDPDQKITIAHNDGNSFIEIDGATINIHGNSTINLSSNSAIQATSNDVWLNSNFVKVGHNPVQGSAVLGENLYLVLKGMAAAIDAKSPPTPGSTVSLVESFRSIVLSNSVKISL